MLPGKRKSIFACSDSDCNLHEANPAVASRVQNRPREALGNIEIEIGTLAVVGVVPTLGTLASWRSKSKDDRKCRRRRI